MQPNLHLEALANLPRAGYITPTEWPTTPGGFTIIYKRTVQIIDRGNLFLYLCSDALYLLWKQRNPKHAQAHAGILTASRQSESKCAQEQQNRWRSLKIPHTAAVWQRIHRSRAEEKRTEAPRACASCRTCRLEIAARAQPTSSWLSSDLLDRTGRAIIGMV